MVYSVIVPCIVPDKAMVRAIVKAMLREKVSSLAGHSNPGVKI